MGIIQFLKKCYNTEMYSRGETLFEVAGKYLGLIFAFFVVLPFYLGYLYMGYLLIQGIVKWFFSDNQLLSNQWLWILTGILLGLFLSVLFQAVPKRGETPRNILIMLFHHLIFLSTFLFALFFWIVLIKIFVVFFGF